MPTVKTVSVTYERKQNLGDYNSANVGCTIWADVREDEDLDTAMRELWGMAKANVRTQLQPLVKPGSLKVEEVFLGLPVELQQAAAASEPLVKVNGKPVNGNGKGQPMA